LYCYNLFIQPKNNHIMKKLVIISILVLLSGITFGQINDDLRNELVSRLVGEWTNIDSNTRGISKVIITIENNELAISGFGKCSPTDCEWGKVKAHEIAASVDYNDNILPFDYLLAIWEIDGKSKNDITEIMKITIETGPKPKLHIDCTTIFNDKRESSDYHGYATMVKNSQSEI